MPELDEYGYVIYDPEEHGWIYENYGDGPSYTKNVEGQLYEIVLTHHGIFVCRDDEMFVVNSHGYGNGVVGQYPATSEAVAWEIDHKLWKSENKNV